MMIQGFEFTLKDGRTAYVRNPKEEDIPGILDYLYRSSGETVFILRYPEECTKYTYEKEKALFERMNTSDNEEMLVCFVDGKVAGKNKYCIKVWCIRFFCVTLHPNGRTNIRATQKY